MYPGTDQRVPSNEGIGNSLDVAEPLDFQELNEFSRIKYFGPFSLPIEAHEKIIIIYYFSKVFTLSQAFK
jgi:hypothetical protein